MKYTAEIFISLMVFGALGWKFNKKDWSRIPASSSTPSSKTSKSNVDKAVLNRLPSKDHERKIVTLFGLSTNMSQDDFKRKHPEAKCEPTTYTARSVDPYEIARIEPNQSAYYALSEKYKTEKPEGQSLFEFAGLKLDVERCSFKTDVNSEDTSVYFLNGKIESIHRRYEKSRLSIDLKLMFRDLEARFNVKPIFYAKNFVQQDIYRFDLGDDTYVKVIVQPSRTVGYTEVNEYVTSVIYETPDEERFYKSKWEDFKLKSMIKPNNGGI